jgi:hypothetical protein
MMFDQREIEIRGGTPESPIFLSPRQALHLSAVINYTREIDGLCEVIATGGTQLPSDLLAALELGLAEAEAGLGDLLAHTPL